MKQTVAAFRVVSIFYILLSLMFVIFSYGFVDPNLTLSTSSWYTHIHTVLSSFVFGQREMTGAVYGVFVLVYFGLYVWLLRRGESLPVARVARLLVGVSLILTTAYTAVSYDVFNYIATAKVTFFHHENPYIVMPIDIPNDPNLAFTRAANKVALYGPTWIVLTSIPHLLGVGHVWSTMILFKLFVVMWLWGMSYIIWKATKSVTAVIFFALNPLVLIETAVAGHNDVVMMTFAIGALLAVHSRRSWMRIVSWILFLLAAGVKGATLALIPFMTGWWDKEKMLKWSFWVMVGVFVILAPLREELYPWYAVWFLPIAALLWSQNKRFEAYFAMAFSLGLELRHIPYMVMGYYEGPGPVLRALLTSIPVVCFAMYWWRMKLHNQKKS